MTNLEKVVRYLENAQIFYLATTDGDQPKCRPIGFQMVHNGRLYFGVGTFKEVYRQMQKNPKVELCASDGQGFLRLTGKAVFDGDPALAEAALNAAPMLRDIYNAQTGYALGVFHLEEAAAAFHSMLKAEESFPL